MDETKFRERIDDAERNELLRLKTLVSVAAQIAERNYIVRRNETHARARDNTFSNGRIDNL